MDGINKILLVRHLLKISKNSISYHTNGIPRREQFQASIIITDKGEVLKDMLLVAREPIDDWWFNVEQFLLSIKMDEVTTGLIGSGDYIKVLLLDNEEILSKLNSLDAHSHDIIMTKDCKILKCRLFNKKELRTPKSKNEYKKSKYRSLFAE